MIKHIVLTRFRSDVSEDTISEIYAGLAGVTARLEGASGFHGGRSTSPEKIERGYMHGFTIDFDSFDDLAAYSEDAEHKRWGAEIVAHAEGGLDGVLVLDVEACADDRRSDVMLKLPTQDGRIEDYRLHGTPLVPRAPKVALTRTAFAAAHVVSDPVAERDPWTGRPAVDWDTTLVFRQGLWDQGLGLAEAMDTAQRGMGVDWATARELIERTMVAAKAHPQKPRVACGAGTDHCELSELTTSEAITAAYEHQAEVIEAAGGQLILMATRALPAIGADKEVYRKVYRRLIDGAAQPVILHWLGDMFDPALKGYWGCDSVEAASDFVLELIAEKPNQVDGIKISLLDQAHEEAFRARLPEGVRLYTGDDFNYAPLIEGDGTNHSHALLGIFAAIAPAASQALEALAMCDMHRYHALLAPTVPLSREIFRAPTRFYKAGIAYLAWLNGAQSHFIMPGGFQASRDITHYAEVFRLADAAGLLSQPELAETRMKALLSLHGICHLAAMERRPTIKDVAREAGVSKSTVSLVLQGSSLVKSETREHVQKVMAEIGYVYNRAAAKLRSGSTGLIGLVINDLRNPFFSELAASLQRSLSQQDYAAVVANTEEDPALQQKMINALIEHGVSAFVICPTYDDSGQALEPIARAGLPAMQVFRRVDNRLDQFPFAAPDYAEGGRLATEHLLSQGAKQIAFVGGLDGRPVTQERVSGYLKVMDERGQQPVVLTGAATRQFGREQAQVLQERFPEVDGVICFNDLVALGLVASASAQGRLIGAELRVVGVDDIEECAHSAPPLSSVSCRIPEFATHISDTLLGWLTQGPAPAPDVRTPVSLMVRASSGES